MWLLRNLQTVVNNNYHNFTIIENKFKNYYIIPWSKKYDFNRINYFFK